MNRPTTTDHSVVAAPLNGHPLADLIAHEIRERGGWMRFERFMELALYAPGLGYYSGGRRVIGTGPQDGSDFVTAPELTPLFGQVVATQLRQALDATGLKRLVVAGGVGANLALRQQLQTACQARGVRVHYPELALCTDNGAMIALAAALRLQTGKAHLRDDYAFDVKPRWPLSELSEN